MTGKKIILSGVQPTGNLHLGNYLGAIENWVQLQNEGDALFCIVDLHALTVFGQRERPQDAVYHTAAAYLAAGIDPKKAKIFIQSEVPQHSQLQWLLACHTPLGRLNRMTQFKEKAPKDKNEASLGLYSYPVLMAADILLYRATHVPVGEDQAQHLELARDIAASINHQIGRELFVLPEGIWGKVARVMSLRNGLQKMSKSEPSQFSRINLTDGPEEIVLKIQKAKTDSQPLPHDPKELESRPEAKNLLNIYRAVTKKSLAQAIKEWGGRNFSEFKPALAAEITRAVSPIGEKMTRLLKDERVYLERVLAEGRREAVARASATLEEAHSAFGLSPPSSL